MMYPVRRNNNFFKLADILVAGALIINFLNYQENKKQALISAKIADNLQKINNENLLERLIKDVKEE